MPLTRVNINNVNTTVTSIADPLLVVNKNSTAANVDIGLVFNRDGGATSNVAIIWDETNDQFALVTTSSSGATNANVVVSSYANVTAGNLTVTGITGNLIPSANVTYSLGDETHWWKSLYVSGSTIYIGGTPLTVSGGTLLTGGIEVTGIVKATSFLETVYAVTGTTPQIAATNGSVQTWTLSGNSTPTDGLNAGESVTLMIDDGSAYTITWTSTVDEWIGGVAPDLATTGYTVIELWKVGTTVYGAYVGDAS